MYYVTAHYDVMRHFEEIVDSCEVICSNVETILSWTCHVYGPFEFRASLGTSILLINDVIICIDMIHFLVIFLKHKFHLFSYNIRYKWRLSVERRWNYCIFKGRLKGFKGTWTRLVKFVYNFFLPQMFIHHQYEAIFKQNNHFLTHCAWNRATRDIWRKRK